MIISGDLNGHVGMCGRDATSHGNRGFGKRNHDEDRILWFADTFDLVSANTWFTNVESQLIIFSPGNHKV